MTRLNRITASTWNLNGVRLRYEYGPRNNTPGLFICDEHGEQRERKINGFVFAPEPACEHVMSVGTGNGFWTD